MEDYTGFKEIVLTDENANDVYAKPCRNVFGCLMNEYLIVKNQDGEVVELLRCDGETMSPITYKPINSAYVGEIKPRNEHQKLAVDMLFHPASSVKVLAGPYGAGEILPLCLVTCR